jgi:uncharacterized protein YndB with AHSA1/START domain
MTIAPVVKTISVAVPPARAFEVFTRHMGGWWKPGMTVAAEPHVDIVIEPRPGGRWFERDAAGVETQWGRVLAWEPPHRLLLAWQLDAHFKYDPDFEVELEIGFAPEGDGGTRVTLEHRNMERFGDSAATIAESVGRGWPMLLELYADYAGQKETTK